MATLYGLPVENGRVRCIVTRPFEIYRRGGRYGFTPGEIEAELRRSEPRFLPDNETPAEADDFALIEGFSDHDRVQLHDRGAYYFADLLGDHPGVRSWTYSKMDDASRRMKVLAAFRESAAQVGIAASLKGQAEDPVVKLRQALDAWASGDNEAGLLVADLLPDIDPDSVADELAAAYEVRIGKPGRRGAPKMASEILASLQ